MFERFTERARQAVVFANDESRALKHNYIGTEHLLLGLLREDEGTAANALKSLGVTLEDVRLRVARVVGEGEEVPTGQIPFTPRAQKVLELALREALALGHNYIGPEHILLGLVRENDGVASRVLDDLDANARKVAEEATKLMGGAPPEYVGGFSLPPADLSSQSSSTVRLLPGTFATPPRRVTARARPMPRRVSQYEGPSLGRVVVPGAAVAAGVVLGLLAGWLIWG